MLPIVETTQDRSWWYSPPLFFKLNAPTRYYEKTTDSYSYLVCEFNWFADGANNRYTCLSSWGPWWC